MKMQTLETVLAEIAKLQTLAEKLRVAERDGVMDRIRTAMAAYNITLQELEFAPTCKTPQHVAVHKRMRKTLPAKYMDPNNRANTWSGLGHRPQWMQEHLAKGGAKSDLLIKPS